ncbi:MAG TPA: efflux RND transporter periplasmic adaptor subunit [Steroidobacteraceae bacterium]|jgi:multidrug efflux system membrane fusion protein|nr:efflux RND transporter periplasmic adaptor subunit [Steroidobacteraceae bacterium]
MNARSASLFIALLAAALLAGCSSSASDTASQPTPVRVQAAFTGPARPPIATNGTVATKDEMRLSFKAGGIIKAIYVSEGSLIKKGQKLAEIELTEVNAAVEQARQLAAKAQRDLERGERLYADQVISLEQLQDLRTQASVAHAQLESAEFNRGYSVITAPHDGVVLRKLAEEREVVPAGQPVLIVGARERGYVVKAALSDREVVQLALGDPAEIRMDAYPGQTIAGTISEIARAADERTGLFPVEVRFDSVPVTLASGLVAKLKLYPASGRTSRLTYVPIAAVVEGDGDRASVFVVNGARVQRRAVQIAFIAPDSVALAEGLKPGERVVTDGALYLQDGEQIQIVNETTRVVGNLDVRGG